MSNRVSLKAGVSGIAMSGPSAISAPFVTRRHGAIVGVESNADAAFRRAILAGAPADAAKQFRDAFTNGPKGDGGKHAREYFGGGKLPTIKAHIHPLVEVLDTFFASHLLLPGFNKWLSVTGFGDDYRFIKGLIAWADHQKEANDAPAGGAAGRKVVS